jgi:hypothetical protein
MRAESHRILHMQCAAAYADLHADLYMRYIFNEYRM